MKIKSYIEFINENNSEDDYNIEEDDSDDFSMEETLVNLIISGELSIDDLWLETNVNSALLYYSILKNCEELTEHIFSKINEDNIGLDLDWSEYASLKLAIDKDDKKLVVSLIDNCLADGGDITNDFAYLMDEENDKYAKYLIDLQGIDSENDMGRYVWECVNSHDYDMFKYLLAEVYKNKKSIFKTKHLVKVDKDIIERCIENVDENNKTLNKIIEMISKDLDENPKNIKEYEFLFTNDNIKVHLPKEFVNDYEHYIEIDKYM